MIKQINNVLSLFDGMSGGQQTFKELGIKVNKYFASEIDKYAIQVTQKNHPNTVQLGSVTDIDTSKLPKIDILIGGSPCQSFSFAGKQNGMTVKGGEEILTLERYKELKNNGFEFDGQSYLFWEYVRILKEVKPKYFFLENVMMTEKWEKVISKTLGVNPICINSALVSAQNRKRLYWTNIGLEQDKTDLFGGMKSIIPQPNDKGILLKDVLEREVSKKYHLSQKMIDCLNKRKGTTYDTFYPTKGEGKARTIKSTVAKMDTGDNYIKIELNTHPSGNGMNGNVYNTNYKSPVLTTNKGEGIKIITHSLQPRSEKGKGGKGHLCKTDNKSYCLDTGNCQAIEKDTIIRRLTPVECERLQGFPDNYTDVVSDSQRYKMLGNGWQVDTIKHMFKYIV